MAYVYASVPVGITKFLKGENPKAFQEPEVNCYSTPTRALEAGILGRDHTGYGCVCSLKLWLEDEKIREENAQGVIARTEIPSDKIKEAWLGITGGDFLGSWKHCIIQPEYGTYLQQSDWDYARAQVAEGMHFTNEISSDILKNASIRDEIDNIKFNCASMLRQDLRDITKSGDRVPGLPRETDYYWAASRQFYAAVHACEGDSFAKLGAGLRAMCEFHDQQVGAICPAAHSFTPTEMLQTYLQRELPKAETRPINFPSDAHAYAFTQCLMLPDALQQATFDAFCKKYAERQQEGMDTKAVASLFKQCASETQHLVDTADLNTPDTPDIDDIEQDEVL